MSVFQKGDKVKFVNAVGGGVVTKVEGDKVFVQDDTGFDIPVMPSELIRMADQTGAAKVFNQEVASLKVATVNVKPLTPAEAVKVVNKSYESNSQIEMEDEIKRLRSQNANLKERIRQLESQIANLQRTLAKVSQ